MLIINTILCSLIVLRLTLFVRTGSHRYVMSVCAYLIALAAGSEVILSLYGKLAAPSVSEIVLKLVLCIALFQVRGNVAKLLMPKTQRQFTPLSQPQSLKTKQR